MDMRSANRDGLMNKTFEILKRSLNFRSMKHQVISGNLANINTLDYQKRKLTFDEALIKASNQDTVQMQATQPGHIPGQQNGQGNNFPVEVSDMIGGIDIDQEMANMMQNSLLYEANIKLISKKIQALKSAIQGSGR